MYVAPVALRFPTKRAALFPARPLFSMRSISTLTNVCSGYTDTVAGSSSPHHNRERNPHYNRREHNPHHNSRGHNRSRNIPDHNSKDWKRKPLPKQGHPQQPRESTTHHDAIELQLRWVSQPPLDQSSRLMPTRLVLVSYHFPHIC